MHSQYEYWEREKDVGNEENSHFQKKVTIYFFLFFKEWFSYNQNNYYNKGII
jgi:hypothetical protein